MGNTCYPPHLGILAESSGPLLTETVAGSIKTDIMTLEFHFKKSFIEGPRHRWERWMNTIRIYYIRKGTNLLRRRRIGTQTEAQQHGV
ncbi:hypothetical protein CHARACLAT_024828 [Characodon lateralis]|uniref:Uncharacterized protein n=1 Tax=Characodon lateralis TaxID=208331 RepID=A0ABU7CRG4_9TELE|nr:hypothetical protein [Characodon lateralis]